MLLLIHQLTFACTWAALAVSIPTASAQSVLLNEIYVNPPGNTLPHEFIELKGRPSSRSTVTSSSLSTPMPASPDARTLS